MWKTDDTATNRLRTVAKSVMPRALRRALRAAHRHFVFSYAMRRFLRDPCACTDPNNPTITQLIYGWGNDWSALEDYLRCCIEHALDTTGPVLECGSGLTTILLGAIAKARGYRHYAIEHIPEWASRTQQYLEAYGLGSVVLCVAPLKDYGEFSWYDAAPESMPTFSLIICDGPPARTKGGRYGLAPIMRHRLREGSVILLDDAHREEEVAIAQRWAAELNATYSVRGSTRPYIEMTVITSATAAPEPGTGSLKAGDDRVFDGHRTKG